MILNHYQILFAGRMEGGEYRFYRPAFMTTDDQVLMPGLK